MKSWGRVNVTSQDFLGLPVEIVHENKQTNNTNKQKKEREKERKEKKRKEKKRRKKNGWSWLRP